ncbi:4350_t:CDS:1, partial [Paraglomus brasilianum]
YKEIHKSYTSLHYQFPPPLKKPNTMAFNVYTIESLDSNESI